MSTLKTNNIQHVDRSDPSIIINTDGSVNIAGTMTYEDVTNVDAVGIITGRSNIDAQKQVHVGTGVSVKAGGINVTAGITTVQALQATSGTFSSTISVAGNAAFTNNIDLNSDTHKIKIGAGDDFQLYHNGSSNNIFTNNGNINISTTDAAAITFSTNGSERVRFHSTGRVGIGDDAPDVQLNVKGSGTSFAGQNTHVKIEDTTSSAANVGGLLAFEGIYDSSNNPAAFAMIHGGKENGTNSNYAGYLRFFTRSNGSLPGERIRIDSNGRLLVNRTAAYASSSEKLTVGGMTAIIGADGASSPLYIYNTDQTGSGHVQPYLFLHDGNGIRGGLGLQYSTSNFVINGNNVIQFRTGATGVSGTERMRLDSNGRLLMGTTTEGAAGADDLTIATSGNTGITLRSGTSSEGSLFFSDATSGTAEYVGYIIYDHSSNKMSFAAAGDLRMVIRENRIDIQGDHSGNGVSNATLRFAILDSNGNDKKAEIKSEKVGDINSTLDFGTTVSHSFARRFMVNSSGQTIFGGNDGVGGGSGGVRLQNPDAGTCRFGSTNSGQLTYIQFINGSSIIGSISGNNATAYNTSSDYRLKENETAITDGITRLKQLKPYRFNWKSDSSTIVDGFFAHEVSSIVPESITGTKDAVAIEDDVNKGLAESIGDPIYQNIDHSKLVPLLTAALQEEVAKREELEARVASLESAIRN